MDCDWTTAEICDWLEERWAIGVIDGGLDEAAALNQAHEDFEVMEDGRNE